MAERAETIEVPESHLRSTLRFNRTPSDLIDRLQEMFRDPDPDNRKHILRFLELAHALFDDAAGTSGGPGAVGIRPS